MNQSNFRLPPEVIAALRAQAESLGLRYSSHVRSQLIAVSRKPFNILKPTRETA